MFHHAGKGAGSVLEPMGASLNMSGIPICSECVEEGPRDAILMTLRFTAFIRIHHDDCASFILVKLIPRKVELGGL